MITSFLLIFRQLVELYNKYSEAEGLRILGFPCNQFGGQEPGTEQEIKVRLFFIQVVVAVYHITIVAIGHALMKKLWPLEIG